MPETILDKNTGEVFISDYQRYAIYIIYKRVLPGLSDGLKCVNRRVLYSMFHDTKVYPKSSGDKRAKSSACIGDVMKKYHPHGDSGVYSAILGMAGNYNCKIPLIDHQGNVGSPQKGPDDASASRYTEVGLSNFAYDIYIDDIVKATNCIDYTENYDGKYMEPEYLPCKIPILLVNGCFGIAVGTKCEISSHNLNEVIDATLHLMDNPNSNIILIPDHCQECYIIDDTNWKNMCDIGYGYYKIRSRVDIEEYKGKTALVIKSVHDRIYLDSIIDDIEKLIEKKKIVQIENIFDESSLDPKDDDNVNLRYVIVLKPGSNAEYVRDVLYKNTKLEDTIRENFLVLNGLEPIRLSYKGYILSWLDTRRMTKFRVYSNQLQSVQTKIHEREAYIKVLESGEIDSIINKIRSQKTVDDNGLVEWLIKKFKITDLQASYIMNVNTKKLSIGYLNKYKEEKKELEIEMNHILGMLSNSNNIDNEIREELIYIKNKYGTPRKCKLIKGNKVEDNIPTGIMTIIVNDKNFIKKFPEGVPVKLNKNESIKVSMQIDNADNMILFDDMGKVFKLPVHNIPLSDKANDGIDLRFLVKKLTSNIISIISENSILEYNKLNAKNENIYMVVTSHSGIIKKMLLDEFTAITNSGLIYSRIDDNDKISSVVLSPITTDIIMYSDHKALRLSMNDIPTLKRNTRGYKAMNVDHIDGLVYINSNTKDIIVVTESGKINKISAVALPSYKKSKNGFNVIKLVKGDKINSIIAINNDNENIRIIGSEDTLVIPVKDIPDGSSISSGVKLFKNKNIILNVSIV